MPSYQVGSKTIPKGKSIFEFQMATHIEKDGSYSVCIPVLK